MKISIKFIKDLGWHEYEGTFVKKPYSFSLTWKTDNSYFHVKDLFFPELVDSNAFLETEEDYNHFTKDTLIATQHATMSEIADFRSASLLLSYRDALESLIRRIPSWDENVRTNQLQLFTSESLKKKFYIVNIDLDDFLDEEFNINGEKRTFALLKARLNEKQNSGIKQKVNALLKDTNKYYHLINKSNW